MNSLLFSGLLVNAILSSTYGSNIILSILVAYAGVLLLFLPYLNVLSYFLIGFANPFFMLKDSIKISSRVRLYNNSYLSFYNSHIMLLLVLFSLTGASVVITFLSDLLVIFVIIAVLIISSVSLCFIRNIDSSSINLNASEFSEYYFSDICQFENLLFLGLYFFESGSVIVRSQYFHSNSIYIGGSFLFIPILMYLHGKFGKRLSLTIACFTLQIVSNILNQNIWYLESIFDAFSLSVMMYDCNFLSIILFSLNCVSLRPEDCKMIPIYFSHILGFLTFSCIENFVDDSITILRYIGPCVTILLSFIALINNYLNNGKLEDKTGIRLYFY